MTKLFRRLKSKKGFTLVELIVVIAILAILAAVAIPAYSGYIKKANDAAVQTELGAILTAAEAANALNAKAIDTITVTTAGVVTVALKDGGTLSSTYYTDFATYHGNASATENTSATVSGLGTKLANSGSFTTGAKWNGTAWVAGN